VICICCDNQWLDMGKLLMCKTLCVYSVLQVNQHRLSCAVSINAAEYLFKTSRELKICR